MKNVKYFFFAMSQTYKAWKTQRSNKMQISILKRMTWAAFKNIFILGA